MNERFLYYLWENRLINRKLSTVTGTPVEVVNPGFRNTDSGPDYLEAKIGLGEQLWAGHVEIHVRTSDWNRHGHQQDRAYRNVVLHVVYEHDTMVNDVPVVALKGQFDERLFDDYQRFVTAQRWIACERQLQQVPPFTRNTWLERMAVERLEEKSKNVARTLEAGKFDWEDTLYRLVLRYFGMKVNNEAFETLASLLPLKTLLKHADNLTQVEAMLLGCAGFLDAVPQEPYPLLLRREFEAMRAKFGLLTMPPERGKFMRMRPVNFPTVRIAQVAQMIHQHGCLFSKIKEAEDAETVKVLFDVKASDYWDSHYRFTATAETPSEHSPAMKPKHLGQGAADVLVINAVVPLLFCYGQFHKSPSHCEKALRFLEDTEAEDNSVVRRFAALGVKAGNAMQTQALLHLYSHYCRRKRCLECRIGNTLIR